MNDYNDEKHRRSLYPKDDPYRFEICLFDYHTNWQISISQQAIQEKSVMRCLDDANDEWVSIVKEFARQILDKDEGAQS